MTRSACVLVSIVSMALCLATLGAKAKHPRAKHDEPATQATEAAASQPDHSSDPIAQALDQAKDEHGAALDSAKKKWLDMIDARTKAAENRGDLKTVESLTKAKESVQKDGTMPEDVKDVSVIGAGKAYQGAVKQADQKLVAAYQKAIKDYTKAHHVAEAEAAQKELDDMHDGAGATASAGGSSMDYQHLGGSRGVPAYLKMPDGVQSTNDGLHQSRHADQNQGR